MLETLKKLYSSLNLKNLFRNQVIHNLLTVGIITLFLKGISFYKETLVAASFGLSEVLDTYFIAFLVPGFIMNVFIGSFKNVFIPNYVAELKNGRRISSFQATGFFVTGVISLIFMLIAYLFTDVYLENFFPGHTPDYYSLIKDHFYYGLPCILFWGFSSLLGGLLNIDNEFRLSSFSGLFVPAAIIICILFFDDIFGNMVLAIGTLIGSVLSFVYLLACCIWKNIIHLSIPDFSNNNAKIMFTQIPAKVSSGFLSGMNKVVDQFFAAQLIVGSIAAINYGMKIPAFLSGLLVIAISNVLLPYFSKAILNDRAKAFRTLFKVLKITFIGSAIFAILGIVFSNFLVELLFQRNEFTSEDSIIVSSIQKAFLAYLPFSISGMVIVNFLTSINKNAFMAYVALGALTLNIILDFILVKYYGVLGIAICTTIVVIIKNLIHFAYVYKQSKIIMPMDSANL